MLTNEELQEIKVELQTILSRVEAYGETPEAMYGSRVARLLEGTAALIAEVERLREIVAAYLSLDKAEHPEWFRVQRKGYDLAGPTTPRRRLQKQGEN